MPSLACRSPSMRRRGRQLLAASSYLCLALLLDEPSAAWAADLGAPPAMVTKAPAPIFQDHWFFSLEGGYAHRGSGSNVTFDPADSFVAGLPPVGPGHAGATFAVEAGRTFGPQWDLALGYRHTLLGTAQTNLATTLPIALPGGTFNNLNSAASSSLRFQTFDAELGYRIPQWSGANVRVFAGPRVLNAHQDIAYSYLDVADFNVFGPTTTTKLGNFDHDIDLWGVGPRVGLDASVPLSQTMPVSLDLTGAGSAIFSHVTNDSSFAFNNFGLTGAGASTIKSSRTIYELEASAGLSYHLGHTTTLEAGYQVQQWYRLATSVNAANTAGAFVEGTENVLVHGPFAKITVELP